MSSSCLLLRTILTGLLFSLLYCFLVHEPLLHILRSLNPFPSKSTIWHKMQLWAQYLVNLCEICTTKRSWKDLQIEGIKLYPLLYETWFTTPQMFGIFFFCTLRVQLSYNKQCTESCILSYSLVGYPVYTTNRNIFYVFLLSFWTFLTLISDLLHLCWCDL